MTVVPKVTVQVQLPAEDVVWFTEQAGKEDMSRSALMRQALRQYRDEVKSNSLPNI